MKNILVFAIIVCLTVVFALVLAPENDNNEFIWSPVIGAVKMPGQGFINTNKSIFKSVNLEDGYVSGMLMFVADKSHTETINGSVVNVRAVVKTLIMECKTGKTTSVLDMLFDTDVVSVNTTPVAMIAKDPDDLEVFIVEKKSVLYTTMCHGFI